MKAISRVMSEDGPAMMALRVSLDRAGPEGTCCVRRAGISIVHFYRQSYGWGIDIPSPSSRAVPYATSAFPVTYSPRSSCPRTTVCGGTPMRWPQGHSRPPFFAFPTKRIELATLTSSTCHSLTAQTKQILTCLAFHKRIDL